MFTIFATMAVLATTTTRKTVEVKKPETKPEYLVEVDRLMGEIFTANRIEEYKKQGLM